MKRFVRFSLGLFFVLSQLALSLSGQDAVGRAAGPFPERTDAFIDAVERALQASQETNLALLLNNWRIDSTGLSQDGEWGIAWLGLYDAQTGELLATEPGLVMGHWDGAAWQVAQPQDAVWLEWLVQAPDDLLTAGQKQFWLDVMQGYEQEAQTLEPLGGYFLPWPAGETHRLTGSVIHDEYIESGSAHYAFDFYHNGDQWPIYASRSGAVWMWRDTVPDGDDSDVGNYLVLKDNANDIYHLYLHLAQNSIPPDLKVVGAPVMRGQFIGVADDTGHSTVNHLHFHVHQDPSCYWGDSIDITFEDVDIYGGRPRLPTEVDDEVCGGVCTDGQFFYTSENVLSGDLTPPYGELSGVSTGDVVNATTLTISGWGADDESSLRLGQLVVNYDGAWHQIGADFTSSFTYNWDLCDLSNPIPDGPVSLALRLEDWGGNANRLAGIQYFIKDAACPVPPPACAPGATQVALFAGADYTGDCARYEVGDHATLAPLADADVESILVGQNVVATLYSEADYSGHSQAFLANDSYLVGDLIGANTAASMRVAARTALPLAPLPLSLQTGAFAQDDLIPLSWTNGGGAAAYQVQVTSAVTDTILTGWLTPTYTTIGDLPQGVYTWQVRGRGPAGEGPWSSEQSFTVGPAEVWGTPVSLPFEDDMESSEADWTATGQWNLKDSESQAHEGEHAWWYAEYTNYDNGLPNMGTLTSPPISVTDMGYYLRFWYRYETESHERVWDQRWLQIAVDGGPFENLYPFGDDPFYTEYDSDKKWIQSPFFSLDAYSGQTIRLRFAFLTMDGSLNAYAGWGIDDLSITATPPPSCSDTRLDDTPAQAYTLTYTTTFTSPAAICPGGDYDYYQFEGVAGERVVIDIDARVDGSEMDPYVVLFDSDGVSMLVENDDEVYITLRDSLLAYTLPHDGVYYIQVRHWKHPHEGGDDYDYRLRVYADAGEPQAIFDLPPSNMALLDEPLVVTVEINDSPQNMIQKVEFYWHSTNWQSGAWELATTDRDGTDGWHYTYSLASQPEGWGSAVYVRVFDQAGNIAEEAAWNLGVDRTAPVSSMEPLTDTQSSPAIYLVWEGSDNLTGIDYYNLQHITDGGTSWSDPPDVFDGDLQQAWWIGVPGEMYGFRLQAVDHSFNVEPYPTAAEAQTSIPTADILCAELDGYEAAGGDNTPETATHLLLEDIPQLHNFCNPITTTFENDEDWFTFTVQAGTEYLVRAGPLHPASAPSLSLYAYEGVTLTLIAEQDPLRFGQVNPLTWVADRDGVVYLRVANLDGRVIGTDVAYSLLLVRDPQCVFMPLFGRLAAFSAP